MDSLALCTKACGEIGQPSGCMTEFAIAITWLFKITPHVEPDISPHPGIGSILMPGGYPSNILEFIANSIDVLFNAKGNGVITSAMNILFNYVGLYNVIIAPTTIWEITLLFLNYNLPLLYRIVVGLAFGFVIAPIGWILCYLDISVFSCLVWFICDVVIDVLNLGFCGVNFCPCEACPSLVYAGLDFPITLWEFCTPLSTSPLIFIYDWMKGLLGWDNLF